MIVRPAKLSDANAIAAVNVASWVEAYRHLMPVHYLDSLSVTEYETKWLDRLSSGATGVLVAEDGEEIVGYIEFGPHEASGQCHELMAFYVHPRHWSSGVGRALWLAARSACLEAGVKELFLWVLAGNVRGIRFYEAAGFSLDATVSRTITRGGKELKQLRYAQRLDGSPQTRTIRYTDMS